MSIEKYNFYDEDLSHSHSHSISGELYLDVEYECYDHRGQATVMLNKDDVIALAQHFNLTADDLKG